MALNNCEPCRELFIRRVGVHIKKDIKYQAACAGVPANKFIKPFLQDIVNAFPDYMKEKTENVENSKRQNIVLRGTSRKFKEQLQNIADYIGVDRGDLAKVMLALQIIELPARNIIPD